MSFAKLSINEIQKLHLNKASGLQILVYAVIASHIHSNKRNNAYPSLRRIQVMLGGDKPVAIQSITRAITALSKKGLIQKGRIRSRKRFLLTHRPIKEVVNSILKATKYFVDRYAPSKILESVSRISTKPISKVSTKPISIHKENIVKTKKTKLFIKRGSHLWSQVCPSGQQNKFDSDAITNQEKKYLHFWINEPEQTWIEETWPEEVSKLKKEVIYE